MFSIGLVEKLFNTCPEYKVSRFSRQPLLVGSHNIRTKSFSTFSLAGGRGVRYT
jgi:hypothetical protein